MGALRIIDLIIFSYVMDRLVSPKVEVTARSMRVISALGSNSLFCFSFTLFLCYGVSLALAVLDGSRAVYLGAILFEVGVMMWLGHLLLTRPGFREATQMKWVERLVQRYFGTSRGSK